MQNTKFNYKRGVLTIDLTAEGYGIIKHKCYDVYANGDKIAFILKEDDAWIAYCVASDWSEDELICGGDTLRECKATLERVNALPKAMRKA